KREHVDAGEEVALLLLVESAEPADDACRMEASPERLEIRHLRPRQHHREALAALPRLLRRPQQIDAAFLDAVVGEMADHGGRIDAPRGTRPRAIAAGAIDDIDAQPLHNQALRSDAAFEKGIAFALRLHEERIGAMREV